MPAPRQNRRHRLEDILDTLSEDEKKELVSVLLRSYQKISKHRGGSEEKE